jgi:hypothetical protein
MSTGDDNIFARWSRRKRTVQDSETPAPKPPERADTAKEEAAPTESQDAVAGREAEPPVTPLPRLEDLTAESDLSVFLQEGVPETLKRAALRKSWSLDQAIRDYIGPSENAWDFNTPGSIPGFGPLEAGKAVVEFLSKMGGGEDVGPAAVAAAPPEAPPASPEPASASPDVPAEPDSPPTGPASAEAPPAPPVVSESEPAPEGPAEAVAGSEGEERPARFAVRARHGGAVPH